jgi:hypothetical protein
LIPHPPGVGAFQFAVLASLRAVQLTRGCRPRIDGIHKNIVIAQLEVSQGKVVRAVDTVAGLYDALEAPGAGNPPGRAEG